MLFPEELLVLFLWTIPHILKRPLFLCLDQSPSSPRCTRVDDSDWHLVTNCAKHSCSSPPLFAFYHHFKVCVPSCGSTAIISRGTLQTFARKMCSGWGEEKERKRRKKKTYAVNVALEPREPTALPSLSVPASVCQRHFFLLLLTGEISDRMHFSAICLFFSPHWEEHRGLSAAQALKYRLLLGIIARNLRCKMFLLNANNVFWCFKLFFFPLSLSFDTQEALLDLTDMANV